MNKQDVERLGALADDRADEVIAMPGEFHPDWHSVRDKFFAALVLEEAAKACFDIRREYRGSDDEYVQGKAEGALYCVEKLRTIAEGLKP